MTTEPDRPPLELRRLLSDMIDGQLSDADFRRLQDLLRDNDANQGHYQRAMTTHALLHLDFAQGFLHLLPPVLEKQPLAIESSHEAPTEAVIEPSRRAPTPAPWRRPAYAATALAAALLLAAAAWQAIAPRGNQQPVAALRGDASAGRSPTPADAPPPTPALPDDNSVAILSHTTGAVWRDGQSPADVGGSMAPGRLRLASGLIQLEFLSGAIVIIEGPADFELVSASRLVCRLGNVRAHVPSQALGFAITTPSYEAVDLGTEFTVQVDPEGDSEFHVLDGEVELWDLRRESRVLAERLTEGHGARATADGELAQIPGRDVRLVDRRELLEITEAARQQHYEAWRRFSEELRSQPRVVAYYGFDGHEGWDRQLRNDGADANEVLNGAIVGCRWTNGRWAGKQALEWKRTTDRVRVNVPGEFDALTLMAWVRIEGLERWLSSLLLADGHELGEIHWQITETGQLLLGVKDHPEFSHDFLSPTVITRSDLGRWMLLTCVYEGPDGYVRHYVDGKEVSAEPADPPLGPVKLQIGRAELGNWAPQDFGTYRVRSLNGRVDEFAIFNEPLTPQEIAAIYNAGNPGT